MRPLRPVRLGPPCRRPILNATTSPLYARRCTRISGSLVPLIEVLSRFEDLIDMVLGPKTQPLHTVHQRASKRREGVLHLWRYTGIKLPLYQSVPLQIAQSRSEHLLTDAVDRPAQRGKAHCTGGQLSDH